LGAFLLCMGDEKSVEHVAVYYLEQHGYQAGRVTLRLLPSDGRAQERLQKGGVRNKRKQTCLCVTNGHQNNVSSSLRYSPTSAW